MSNIDKQALLRAAVKIGAERWHSSGDSVITDDYHDGEKVCFDEVAECRRTEGKSLYAEFIAAANPATVLALLGELEAKDQRIEKLEGELEVSQHDLYDTEDAMRIWAERAEVAEGKSLISSPVAYAPRGHIDRYLNGSNSGCWVYGNPTGEDDDALYLAAPDNAQHFDRNTICETVHSKCSRIPGATFYNAAEFAIDEVERAAAAGKGE